jgi:tetratricopeptide (TPR) repeat protein
MRTTALLAALVTAVLPLGSAPAVAADDWAICKGDDFKAVIASCGALLKKGKLNRTQTIDALTNRAWGYYNTDENTLALADYTECLKRDENNVTCLNGMSATYVSMSWHPDAITIADKVIALNPRNQYGYMNKGNALHATGRYQQAIEQYNKAIEVAPGWVRAFYRRGRSYNEVDRYEDAIADFDKVVLIDPEYTLALGARGYSHRVLGHFDKALEDLNAATAADAKDDWAYVERGMVLLQRNDNEKALADFDTGISMAPTVTWYYGQRGIAKMRLGKIDGAKEDFQRVLKTVKDDAIANVNLGQIYEKAGDKGAAKAFYRAAMLGTVLDPDTRDAQKQALKLLGEMK